MKMTSVEFGERAKREPSTAMRRYCMFLLVTLLMYLAIWTNISGKTKSSTNTIGSQSKIRVNESISRKIPDIPSITDHMYSEAVLSGKKPSHKKFLTIAIPTISRPLGFAYIQATLDSLIKNSNETERRSVIIVILLADFNETSRMNLNDQLVTKYRKFFDSGLMQTIQAPRSYYPSFEKLKQTYNHGIAQVRWRSKQNFDYAFLMEYSAGLSEYYLQLEDDVVTVPEYLHHIKAYMSRISRWTCLEFCELGFIAKFYHSYDLKKLSTLLKLFFNEQPNDVIYLHFNELMLQFQRFIRRPTIFQHKGYVSSSGVDRGMLEDLLFDDTKKLQLKQPVYPVEFRQLGRVRGPEQIVWAKRRRQAAIQHKEFRRHEDGDIAGPTGVI